MYLSKLQKYILLKCFDGKNGIESKAAFYGFYPEEEYGSNKKNIQDAVHKSLDSLVARDFLTAFGHKTSRKWFIHRVKLTARGKRTAGELIRKRQRKLPIK